MLLRLWSNKSTQVVPPFPPLRCRAVEARELPASPERGECVVRAALAIAAPLPGRQTARARELPAPSEQEERAARCRLCRFEESEGAVRAVGVRRARRSRCLLPPPRRQAAGTRRACRLRRCRRRCRRQATGAREARRSRCCAAGATYLSTQVTLPFVAAAPPGRRISRTREPPTPPKQRECAGRTAAFPSHWRHGDSKDGAAARSSRLRPRRRQ